MYCTVLYSTVLEVLIVFGRMLFLDVWSQCDIVTHWSPRTPFHREDNKSWLVICDNSGANKLRWLATLFGSFICQGDNGGQVLTSTTHQHSDFLREQEGERRTGGPRVYITIHIFCIPAKFCLRASRHYAPGERAVTVLVTVVMTRVWQMWALVKFS